MLLAFYTFDAHAIAIYNDCAHCYVVKGAQNAYDHSPF